MSESASLSLLRLTAEIVTAHAAHNALSPEALVQLIGSVHAALAGADRPATTEARPEPAVPVKRSVFPDYIVCLQDGKKLKMLKRHLMNSYNLTPAQYREKWGLPASYPMVAPEYAARRSALAKEIGLGRRPTTKKPAPAKSPVRASRGRPPTQTAAR